MINYRGDMSLKVLVTTATIVDGDDGVLITNDEGNTGMLAKPILIAKSSTVSAFTGSIMVTYSGRINNMPLCSTNIIFTTHIPLEDTDGASWGAVVIDNFDYSMIKIISVENDLGDDVDDLTIYLSGLLNN